MLRTYENVYSALYTFSLKQWKGDEDVASFLTACAVAGALGSNFLLLAGVIIALQGIERLEPFALHFTLPAIIVLILLGNYAVFVRHDRYVKLVARYSKMPMQTKRRIALKAWVYVLISYGAVPLFFFTMAKAQQ